jgi:hypothetical protein
METCATDGNLGFPISITGALSAGDQSFLNIQANPEIVPAFATRTMPRRLNRQNESEVGETQQNIIDESEQNTLLYKGKRYSLIHIQICAADTGGGKWPYTPNGNYKANAAFVYSRLERESPQVVVLTVPLYEKESMENIALQSPKATMYFEDVMKATRDRFSDVAMQPRVANVGNLFGEFANQGYVSYISCIPIRSGPTKMATLNVLSAFFPSGWILPKDLIESIGEYNYKGRSRFAPFFFPPTTRASFPTAIQEPPPSPADSWIQDINNWSDSGETFKNTIMVSSPEFATRFNWIAAGIMAGEGGVGGGVKRLKTTFEYQCMPLDKVKDIDGKYVLLDPATGERSLRDALDGGGRKVEIQMAMKQMDSIKTFAIVIGVIFGFLVGVLILSFVIRYVIKRPIPETAAAFAVAATPQT